AFIGIAGFLRNDEHQEEIAYRLKTAFWGVGYGTEIAEGLLQFGFEECKMELITADVNTENHRSAKILSKFFTPVREFYNNNDQCFDRRYALKREDWKRRFEPNEE
ncbi:MAG: GNAT family N-acetyltransferase, partial [Crocinitomicaceae bacterium]|nr:GNAT family N-acetyltransferase [Crocinitomicaceae bacterium]